MHAQGISLAAQDCQRDSLATYMECYMAAIFIWQTKNSLFVKSNCTLHVQGAILKGINSAPWEVSRTCTTHTYMHLTSHGYIHITCMHTISGNPINHLWPLMSYTPFFRLLKRLVRSAWNKFCSKFFKSAVKWDGKRTYKQDSFFKAHYRVITESLTLPATIFSYTLNGSSTAKNGRYPVAISYVTLLTDWLYWFIKWCNYRSCILLGMTCCALMEWDREMASGIGLALPQDRDAKSWFRKFEICAVVNDWDDKKKLKCLPTLFTNTPERPNMGYFWCPTWCKYWHLCTFEGSTPQLSQPWHRGRQTKC